MTETIREYADVVFPAEAYAEKEGTLTHPDGRLQRLRTAIGRPKPSGPGSGVRPGWQVIADVAARAGHELGVAAGPIASRRLFEAVPFYAGLTLDEIGGRACAGRSARRRAASRCRPWEPVDAEGAARGARAAGRQGRAAARHLPLAVELEGGRRLAGAALPAPAAGGRAVARDAKRLGIADGDRVEVGLATARACAAPCGCATRSRAARSSSPRARRRRPTCSPRRRWRSLASAGRRRTARSRSRSRRAVEAARRGAPSAPLAIPPTGSSQSGHDA